MDSASFGKFQIALPFSATKGNMTKKTSCDIKHDSGVEYAEE